MQVPSKPGLFQVSFATAQVNHFTAIISVTLHISTEFRSSNKKHFINKNIFLFYVGVGFPVYMFCAHFYWSMIALTSFIALQMILPIFRPKFFKGWMVLTSE